jgi:Ca2+-binding RTX toxin-like protein
MASVSFTFNGDYDANNTVVLGQDPFASLYNGTQSPHFVGGYAGFIFFIFNNTGNENDIAPSFTDPANPGDVRMTTQQYSVFADFSDNIAFVKLSGGDFGDILRSGLGNDTLNGGGGNDTFEGGLGRNVIDGGTGINTVSYEHYQESGSGLGVVVDLAGGFGNTIDSLSLTDLLSGIQNIRGSAYLDNLTGDNGANRIESGGGADQIQARAGDDRVVLNGAIVDFVDGGDDYDILVMESGAGAYIFDDGSIVGIEQVNLLDGVVADFSDLTTTFGLFRSASLGGGGVSLTTTGLADKIRAGLAEDTISAGGGDDTVLVLDGGSASIDGGAGTDRLLVQFGSHTFTDATLVDMEFLVVRSGASLDLGAMTASTGKITSTSVAGDGVTIIGTAGAEWIRLGAGGDEVTGGAGNDTLAGGAGDDTFHYEAAGFGRDQLFADLAMDHVDLAGLATSVDDLSFRTSFDGNDVLVSIRGLPDTDVIVLNNVTLADVQAANGFFLF